MTESQGGAGRPTMTSKTVATQPIAGQKPGTSGLRKKVAGVPATALPRELRPGDLRQRPRVGRPDAGGRRRRPLLQRRGDPDHPADGRGEWLRPRAGRAGRHPVDAGRALRDPQAQGVRRHHPVGQPQPGRSRRRFRHQVQHRQRRPGAGEGHRGDLRPHPAHRPSYDADTPDIDLARLGETAARCACRSRSSTRSPTMPR